MFKKMDKTALPPRQWAIVGHSASGKSTFATLLRMPLLPVDADHRFLEVAHLAAGAVLRHRRPSLPAVVPGASPSAITPLISLLTCSAVNYPSFFAWPLLTPSAVWRATCDHCLPYLSRPKVSDEETHFCPGVRVRQA